MIWTVTAALFNNNNYHY